MARCVIRPTTERPGEGSSPSPQRPIPVSSLRCTGTPSGTSASHCRQLERPRARMRDVPVRGRAEDEDPRVGESGAEREALAHRGDAQRDRAARQRRPPGVGGAVAVPVGLDDGPQLGRRDAVGEHAGVVADRAEVDRDERAGHVRRGPRAAPRRRPTRRGRPGARRAARRGRGRQPPPRRPRRARGPSRGMRRRSRSARPPCRRSRASRARGRRRRCGRRVRARSCRGL